MPGETALGNSSGTPLAKRVKFLRRCLRRTVALCLFLALTACIEPRIAFIETVFDATAEAGADRTVPEGTEITLRGYVKQEGLEGDESKRRSGKFFTVTAGWDCRWELKDSVEGYDPFDLAGSAATFTFTAPEVTGDTTVTLKFICTRSIDGFDRMVMDTVDITILDQSAKDDFDAVTGEKTATFDAVAINCSNGQTTKTVPEILDLTVSVGQNLGNSRRAVSLPDEPPFVVEGAERIVDPGSNGYIEPFDFVKHSSILEVVKSTHSQAATEFDSPAIVWKTSRQTDVFFLDGRHGEGRNTLEGVGFPTPAGVELFLVQTIRESFAGVICNGENQRVYMKPAD